MYSVIGIEWGVAVDMLRGGAKVLGDQTRAGIGAAAVRLRGLPLAMLPLAAQDLETMAERLDSPRQLCLVVFDYLQLIPTPSRVVRANHDEDLAVVLRRCKALALERQVALLVLTQAPRLATVRPDPRPTLDDFGHLGAIKQHADVVLAIFREEMYNPGGGAAGAT